MSHQNFLRLFNEMRLSPWLPEHERYIQARIAALEVEDPTDADNKRLGYAKILGAYYKKHPELSIAPAPEEVKKEALKLKPEKVEGKEEVPEPEAPKKRGRKPKIL